MERVNLPVERESKGCQSAPPPQIDQPLPESAALKRRSGLSRHHADLLLLSASVLGEEASFDHETLDDEVSKEREKGSKE